MRYEDQKSSAPIDFQVHIARGNARRIDRRLRETHVRVGDHDPEPRRTGRDAASKRAELGRAAQ